MTTPIPATKNNSSHRDAVMRAQTPGQPHPVPPQIDVRSPAEIVFSVSELQYCLMAALLHTPGQDQESQQMLQQGRDVAHLAATFTLMAGTATRFWQEAPEQFRANALHHHLLHLKRNGVAFTEPLLTRLFNRYRCATAKLARSEQWKNALRNSCWTMLDGAINFKTLAYLHGCTWQPDGPVRSVSLSHPMGSTAISDAVSGSHPNNSSIAVREARLQGYIQEGTTILRGETRLEQLSIRVGSKNWGTLCDVLKANQQIRALTLNASQGAYYVPENDVFFALSRPSLTGVRPGGTAEIAAKVDATKNVRFQDAFAMLATMPGLCALHIDLHDADAVTAPLCELLEKSRSLSEVGLYRLHCATLSEVIHACRTGDRLEKFGVLEATIDPTEATDLGTWIKASQRLQSLQLHSCTFERGSLDLLAEGLNGSRTLTDLKLTDCRYGGFYRFFGALDMPGVRRLSLLESEFGKEDLEALGLMLRRNPQIDYLDLSGIAWPSRGAATRLMSATGGVRTLVLKNTKIGSSVASKIANIFEEKTCPWSRVEFSENTIKPSVRKILSQAQATRNARALKKGDRATLELIFHPLQ